MANAVECTELHDAWTGLLLVPLLADVMLAQPCSHWLHCAMIFGVTGDIHPKESILLLKKGISLLMSHTIALNLVSEIDGNIRG